MAANGARVEQQVHNGKAQAPQQKKHPAQAAGWFSRLFVLWVQPFIVLGAKRPLVNDDLPALTGDWSAEACGEQVQREWDNELKNKGRDKAFLARAVLRAFFWPYALAGVFMFISITGTVVAPMFVRSLLNVLTAEDPTTAWSFTGITDGYVLVALMTVSALVQSVFQIQVLVQTSRVGTLARSGIMNVVFRRAIQLKRNGDSPGLVVNLLSNDTEMFFFAMLMGHFLWMCPVFFVVVVVLLYTQIGAYGAAGAALCLLLVPLQSHIGKRFGKHKRKMLRHTDTRLRLTSEVLGGIQVVKTNAWEPQMGKRILDARDEELKSHRSVLVLNAFNTWLLFLVPNFIGLVVFMIVIHTDPRGVDALDTATVYSALIYINILKFPIWIMPKVVATVSQGYVSAVRLGAFLKAELEEDGSLPAHTLLVNHPNEEEGDKRSLGQVGSADGQQQQLADSGAARRVVVSFKNDSFVWAKPISNLTTANDENKDAGAEAAPAMSKAMIRAQPSDQPKLLSEASVRACVNDGADCKEDMVKLTLPNASASSSSGDGFVDGQERGHNNNNNNNDDVTLHNLTLDICAGELIAIVGAVGSGKSSLVAAILDEIYRLENSESESKDADADAAAAVSGGANTGEEQQRRRRSPIKLTSSAVAYVSQRPWIQHATVRENVVFNVEGADLPPSSLFEDCVAAAQLGPDLLILPHGEDTEIGERGVNLSGGVSKDNKRIVHE
jgi:ATP-binding cassette subfamily C (CFTR/MRP) protein 1